MTRRTGLGLLVVIAAGLITGVTAWAHGGPGGRTAIMKRVATAVIDEALDQAKVTADQRAKIYAARDRVFAALETGRAGRRARGEEVLRLFEADQMDTTKVEALRHQTEADHRAIADVVTQALVEVHDVLTPVQRKAIADYVREHRRHQGG